MPSAAGVREAVKEDVGGGKYSTDYSVRRLSLYKLYYIITNNIDWFTEICHK